ncbi:MAG: hypothetical protein A3I05_08045 [Deltaproteobacteria bacterium RIFCSPLOWO2_02_FULL_44_10]|nr:MAG: hypothetical protein A3C46_01895 [Deltaproteobacteria bacterium RIFCSPHIGHO2_02_FULL_44_16]OGQ45633.1 MAG: hypothetical protein A3I05_08045 [Deltaproteobacteria bacterium RIFCSPLOWO2_02_FULL_44_10]
MNFFRRSFKVLRFFLVLFFLGVVFSLYAALSLWKSPVAIELDIFPGMSVKQIANELSAKKVTRTPALFVLWTRLTGTDQKLRAGFYEFEAGMTLSEVVQKLKKGDVKFFPFQIIEGWTIADIARSLATQDFIPGPVFIDDFRRLAHDPVFAEKIGFPGVPSLEGYLFPETYQLHRPRNAEEVLEIFCREFENVFSAEYETRTQEINMTRHQVMTLASIIEKETGKEEERALISSVFQNRLAKGMPLQTDPTVIYGLRNFDGNLRKHDLLNPHPYNTYIHKGLPPGPIASVGRAAIQAALYPAQTDYLYFVSRNDGSHQFSSTLSEHVKAVMEYQIRQHR